MCFRALLNLTVVFISLVSFNGGAFAEHEGKVQILLLGDSTTEGSVPRRHVPKGPHLEDVIRELLAAEKDLPPTNVINLGLSGEYIRRLLDSGRYEKEVSKLSRMNPAAGVYSVQAGYLDTLLDLPWNVYSEDNFDLRHAERILDEDHYGLEKVKDRILEHLA